LEKANEIKPFGRDLGSAKREAQPTCQFNIACVQTRARTMPDFQSLLPNVNQVPLPIAPLKNRLFCMVYESMLLFGVLFISGWLFSTLLQQRHALVLRHAQQAWQFLVLAVYFGWFWTHGGQTLAMKTWRVRIVTREGKALRWPRALLRYLLAWLWFVPGLAVAALVQAQGWMLILLPALNVVLWAAAVRLDTDRQFIHDRLARTRVVLAPAAKDPLATPASH